MLKSELKAIIMAVLSPNGTSVNLNDQMFKFLSRNADEIMRISGVEEEKFIEKAMDTPEKEG